MRIFSHSSDLSKRGSAGSGLRNHAHKPGAHTGNRIARADTLVIGPQCSIGGTEPYFKRSARMLDYVHEIRVRSPYGPLKVRVTGQAVTALRSKGSQSLPAFVIAEQRELIDRIAIRKYEARELDDDNFVQIDEGDLGLDGREIRLQDPRR